MAATLQLGVDRFPFTSPGVPEASLAPRGVFDENASATVTRALRRRLAAKQRTVRILAILLIVVAAVAVGSTLSSLAKLFSSPGATTTSQAPAAGAADAVDH
ncbi:MAG: hypothetical protein IH889_04795 [Planctomycetes bacterium]|nr:hypothetical protein [Planctomycetota bacterium]